MKKIGLKISVMALLMSAFACRENLDTVDGNVTRNAGSISLFMGTTDATVKIAKSTEGGDTQVEVRMSALSDQDVRATVSVVNFLEEYNKVNNTRFRLLPISEYQLYEVDNPTNVSSNGSLTVTIKAGNASERIGVRVNALDDETYPIGVNYSIPLKITSTSAKGTLSNNQAIVSFERPFKTSVGKIKQGYAFAVKLAPEVEESDEITVQGQFMWERFHPYSGNTINMTLMNIGPYTRIFPKSLQVKDGAGDNPDDNVAYDFDVNKWHQITFTFKDSNFRVYVDGVLIRTFQRTGVKLSKEMVVGVESARTSYSTNRYFREFRLWNRALTQAEIAANTYLPVDPTSEGLVAYLPVTSKTGFTDVTKYDNQVIFAKGTGGTSGIQDGSGWQVDIDYEEFLNQIEWTENVKFPAAGLEIEE